ncbi:MAG: folate-binding protein YgfZ [Marivivens sp.]|nr:folate-binding protein YgfZ [Marivivens sp.]
MPRRTVLAIHGSDRESFLQGLITNDVAKAHPDKDGICYAALLTPQGKLIVDFFVIGRADHYLIDVASDAAPQLAQRLSMYKLRADVQITETPLIVSRGTSPRPDGALADPRDTALGWRAYGEEDLSDGTDFEALRIRHAIPALGAELNGESYILEMGFERLNGVDFRKGCYVGQEVTARMHHKTTLKKGLRRVRVIGEAPSGSDILTGDKVAGTLHSVANGEGLAYLRFDRIGNDMTAGDARIEVID